MSYISLARKYRPQRFEDLVGQESVSLALSNAIRLKREPGAIIFTGVRGIGKTTTARIYAKALNCEESNTAEPCNQCASCLAIQSGTHEDVLEIDGASHTGVDDVRALQETLGYVPQRSKNKIHIIDEVHMLSTSAFNALLKTLEELPAHVYFIFATTELNKVPETIQSRCQVFHLQKISTRKIFERLSAILVNEGIPADETALQWVSKEGRGSLRDALTLLDQVIAVGGGSVTWEAIQPMVQSGHAEPLLELLEALLTKQAQPVLSAISRWDQEGLSIVSLAEELAKACRNAFVLRVTAEGQFDTEILELEEKEKQALTKLGRQSAPLELNRLFRLLARCLEDLRNAELDRFVFENYCIEWCLDPGLPDINSLMRALQSGTPVKMPAGASAAPPQAQPSLTATTASAASAPVPKEAAEAGGLRDRWKRTQSGAPAPIQGATVHAQAQNPAASAPAAQAPSPLTAKPASPVPSQSLPINPSPQLAKQDMPPWETDNESMTKAPAPQPQTAAAPVEFQRDPAPIKAPNSAAPVADRTQDEAVKATPPGAAMPETWRAFVDEWKKQKPLQARVLEETYVLEYSPSKIKLAVEAETMAGKKLLHIDTRKKLLVQFEELFQFKGHFEVVPKSENNQAENPAGETLLETKQKEREVLRESMRRKLEDHPLTREVIKAFDGTIEAIDVQ